MYYITIGFESDKPEDAQTFYNIVADKVEELDQDLMNDIDFEIKIIDMDSD